MHIALLRAINVGGTGKVAMPDLRNLVEELGFKGVKSLLNTGNLVFSSDKTSREPEIEQLLEREAAKKLDLKTDFIIRSGEEWGEAIDANPFPKEAKSDPSHLLVVFLKAAPDKEAVKDLQAAIQGSETVQMSGRQLYAMYPDGIGRSKLTMPLIELKLGTRGTGRNWNTVLKIAAAAMS